MLVLGLDKLIPRVLGLGLESQVFVNITAADKVDSFSVYPVIAGLLYHNCICLHMQMEAVHELALRLWRDYEWALSISGSCSFTSFSGNSLNYYWHFAVVLR